MFVALWFYFTVLKNWPWKAINYWIEKMASDIARCYIYTVKSDVVYSTELGECLGFYSVW